MRPRPRLRQPFTTLCSRQTVIARGRDRPQLTFLTPPSTGTHRSSGAHQLRHLLTSHQKAFLRAQVYDSSRMAVAAGLLVAAIFAGAFAINYDRLDRHYPTPAEWDRLTKMNYVTGRAHELGEIHPFGIPDWHHAWMSYSAVRQRLEADGVADLSARSAAWRQGYHDVLMSLGRVAEHLDGHVLDKSRDVAFHAKYVVGPNNPTASPLPGWLADSVPGGHPPAEEDCDHDAYTPADTFYRLIIDSGGDGQPGLFSAKQRVDAAIALGDWLAFAHQPAAADGVFREAVEIATTAAALTTPDMDEGQLVMWSTSRSSPEMPVPVLRDGPAASADLVRAVSALGVFRAQNGAVRESLPTLLSALRSVRAVGLSPSSSSPSGPGFDQTAKSSSSRTEVVTDIDSIASVVGLAKKYLSAAPYATERADAGTLPLDPGPDTDLVELGLVTNVSEVLFAVSAEKNNTKESSRRADAVSNTRRAAEEAERRGQVAYSRTQRRGPGQTAPQDESAAERARREKFVRAGFVAVENWRTMAEIMWRDERMRMLAGSGNGWFGWFRTGRVDKRGETSEQQENLVIGPAVVSSALFSNSVKDGGDATVKDGRDDRSSRWAVEVEAADQLSDRLRRIEADLFNTRPRPVKFLKLLIPSW